MAGSQGTSQGRGTGTTAASGSRRRSESANPAPAAGVSWEDDEMDEDEDRNETSGGAKQQQLIQKMLDNSGRADKKMAISMLKDKAALVENTEHSIDATFDEADAQIDERVAQVEKIVSANQAIHEKMSAHQVERVEEQLTQLSLLLKDYSKRVNTQTDSRFKPEAHVQHRKKHSSRVSYKAAMVALKETEQAKREQQVQADMKRFTQAHKDLFKSLGNAATTQSTAA